MFILQTDLFRAKFKNVSSSWTHIVTESGLEQLFLINLNLATGLRNIHSNQLVKHLISLLNLYILVSLFSGFHMCDK